MRKQVDAVQDARERLLLCIKPFAHGMPSQSCRWCHTGHVHLPQAVQVEQLAVLGHQLQPGGVQAQLAAPQRIALWQCAGYRERSDELLVHVCWARQVACA